MKPLTLTIGIVAAVALAGCAGSASAPASSPEVTMSAPSSTAAPSSTPAPSADPTAFAVASPDFVDGGELEEKFTADAFGGQCVGDNISPALQWRDAPQGTATFAIAMTDEAPNGWVHWLHAHIPPSLTSPAQRR